MAYPTIDKQSNVPISTQITRWYEERINQGDLQPGDKLPSIREIANKVGTSTTTVKRALDHLQVHSYLTRGEKKELIVTDIDRHRKPELDQSRWQVFWSYARCDDKNTHGAISELMNNIRAEFEVVTGEKLNDFQDTKDIPWGSNWKQIIESNVNSTVFFVPILTPAYLHSANCITEFRTALANLREADIEDGIFPIKLVNYDDALERLVDSQLKQYILDHQHLDCTNIRRLTSSNQLYIQKVGEIVDQMVGMRKKLNHDQDKLNERIENEANYEDADAPGYIERIELINRISPRIENTAEKLSNDIRIIGDDFEDAAQELNNSTSQPNALSMKISICKKLAKKLQAPVGSFKKHCTEFVDLSHQLDVSITAIPAMIKLNQDQRDKTESISALNNMINSIDTASQSMFDGLRSFRDTSNQMKDVSRDLRPIVISLRESCDIMLDLQPMFESWKTLKIG
jgi:DNA-binding transcriptional regulator YhcF (GntR family)